MKAIDKSSVKRILFITLSNIGDIVLTLPALEALLNEFPDAKVDVMVNLKGSKIIEKHKRISDIILYDKKTPFFEKIALFLKLRQRKYDLVVDLRNTVFPFILGARFTTSPFRKNAKCGMHKKDVHLSRLEDMGIDISKSKFFISIGDTDKKSIDSVLKNLGGRPFIVVSPGAKSHVKRWPLENFAALSDMIKKDLNYEVVLVGDENDKLLAENIISKMETRPLNLVRKTTLRELTYLLGKTKLLITNDSAPLHVAGAVGAPILAFFGPTDYKKYGPITQGASKVLRKNIKCAPCETAQCINVKNKYECLKTISVEEAFEAVKELIGNAHPVNANR